LSKRRPAAFRLPPDTNAAQTLSASAQQALSGRRLRLAAGLTAAGYMGLSSAHWLLSPETAMTFPVWVSVGTVGGSVIVALLATRESSRRTWVADLCVLYAVWLGFLLGVVEAWQPWPDVWAVSASWVCVIILAFPLIVPNTPVRVFAAILGAALAWTTGIGVAISMGDGAPTTRAFVSHLVPPFVCVIVGWGMARIVFDLVRDVDEARELGMYRLHRRLARGGMGDVWLASHRMLARPAAVKLIRYESDDDQGQLALAQMRFEREAKATAALSSPHTVQLYDYGIADDGTFYYVMEYIQGLDFDELVQMYGPQPPSRVVYLLEQVCHSLAEAHAADLIHRDIKPGNCMTARLGIDYDFVKILDFGLVKAPDSVDDSKLTQAGRVAGTPAYMAPEMAVEGCEMDGRADIYGLGCVAYWLLTGSQVFESTSAMAQAVSHATMIPPRPSTRLGEPIPEDLDDLVMACLAKSRDDRPQTAAELAERLRACRLDAVWTQADAALWWRERELSLQKK